MTTSNGSDIFKYAVYNGFVPEHAFRDATGIENPDNYAISPASIERAKWNGLTSGNAFLGAAGLYVTQGTSGAYVLSGSGDDKKKRAKQAAADAHLLSELFGEVSTDKVVNFLGNMMDIAGFFMQSAQNKEPPAFVAGSPLAVFFNPKEPVIFAQAEPDPYGFNASTALSRRIPLERPLTLASAPVSNEPDTPAPQNA